VQNNRSAGMAAFTAIELAILSDIADGYQSKEIAVRIARSKPTVESYVRLLCAKMGARSRPHLVACAYRRGLISLSPLAA
jgi:DNA-binding NarL/FixJ family response regulator